MWPLEQQHQATGQNSLGKEILGLHSRITETETLGMGSRNLCFKKTSMWFWLMRMFENHHRFLVFHHNYLQIFFVKEQTLRIVMAALGRTEMVSATLNTQIIWRAFLCPTYVQLIAPPPDISSEAGLGLLTSLPEVLKVQESRNSVLAPLLLLHIASHWWLCQTPAGLRWDKSNGLLRRPANNCKVLFVIFLNDWQMCGNRSWTY